MEKDSNDKNYLEWNQNQWIGQRIIDYTKYKAWQLGIVVTNVRPNYISNKCNHCR
jgi:putative transposase